MNNARVFLLRSLKNQIQYRISCLFNLLACRAAAEEKEKTTFPSLQIEKPVIFCRPSSLMIRLHLCGACARSLSVSLVHFLPLSLRTLWPQICGWHVSLHLARTCTAFGRCVMARGRGNAAPPGHYATRGDVTRETNCLCKGIKTTKQLLPHLLSRLRN